MRSLAAGDIARLLAKYDPVIRGRCRARISNRPDADDVAQNVRLRLLAEHRRGKTYGDHPYRVIVNQVITYTIRDHFEQRATDAPLPEDWEPAAPPDGAHERVHIEDLLAELPEGDRRAGMLRYLHELDPPMIAQLLGTTRNGVDQALFRCRRRLRESYVDA